MTLAADVSLCLLSMGSIGYLWEVDLRELDAATVPPPREEIIESVDDEDSRRASPAWPRSRGTVKHARR